MTTTLETWAAQIRTGDARAISRAVSAIEDHSSEAEALLRQLFPFTGRAWRVGITGAPGTGKSTLVDRLAAHYRTEKKSVGIIAVDPSSPFTGGAILGDRVRMQGHAGDKDIFIRSMATRGYLGGLAQSTGDATLLLDAAGKDMILVETVGVGQGEIEIVRLADCTIVVLVPGMGDDVQSLKAGLMEIADIFVINKSDRDGAARFEEQLGAILQIVPERSGWKPPVVRTVATEDQGVAELARHIALFRDHVSNSANRQARELAYWKEWLLRLVETRLVERVLGNRAKSEAFEKVAAEVAARKKDPYSAVNEILSGERRVKLGDLEFHIISAGHVLLDGGAMFGVIPKPLWEKKMPADARNRITLSMNSLLIHAGGKRVLVETGAGDKMNAKFREIYGIDGPFLDQGLRKFDLQPADIDIVVNTHLHFDHCGGNTRIDNDKVVPAFLNARYVVHRGEYDHALSPTERDRASYIPENYEPVQAAGQFTLLENDSEIAPGVELVRLPGHTANMFGVKLTGGGKTALLFGDLVPTTAHLPLPWIMGYDLYPMTTLENKKRWIPQVVREGWLALFAHDARVSAAYLRERSGQWETEPVTID